MYKVNKYKMLFLHITSYIPLGSVFNVGYCFMPSKKENNYTLVVQYLKELLDILSVNPKVIIID
jgi:hypothetical protein